MAASAQHPPSFSRRRRWSIGLNVLLATVAVFAVVVAVNFISTQIYSHRFFLSAKTSVELSPRTRNLLHSITNHISVTLYYDTEDDLYEDVAALIDEYRLLNRKITVQTVDYTRDLSAAQKIKVKYNKLFAPTDKNLVIFDCDGRVKVVHGDALAKYQLQQIASDDPKKPEFRRKPVEFYGEILFTSALLQVLDVKPAKVYFLTGHGEPGITDSDQLGFQKFAAALEQDYLQVAPLSLTTNDVPSDCSLLIIAGPKTAIPTQELERIQQYLDEGGRLFVAFNIYSADINTGLEKLLAKWGVNVSHGIVKDANTYTGSDIRVESFANHPLVNPLTGEALYMLQPRMISKQDPAPAGTDAPTVTELAFSSPRSVLTDATKPALRSYPLMAAVDEGPHGKVGPRGTTRILVVGDSLFLGNVGITSLANSDFVSYAANWLLDRTALLKGIGPRPINEYRLLITAPQQKRLEWILLGAVPGGVLLFGGLVWLRRRS